MKIVSTLSCFPGGPGPQVFSEATHATLHHGWRSASSLRETLSPIQDQNQYKKPFTHTHSIPHTTSPVQSSPAHICPIPSVPSAKHTHIPQIIYSTAHTNILDVSREGGASASQVERTPDRATLTYWVVGPLHSYTHEGWVDNNIPWGWRVLFGARVLCLNLYF